MEYVMLIDRSSGYHKLKLDEKSSYLTTFSCPFDRYQYIKLPFGSVPVGDMENRWIICGMPNVIGIADNLWNAGFDK